MRLFGFFISVVLISLTSCNYNHFEKHIRFEKNNWTKFNELDIIIPVLADKTYDFTGNIITDSTYNNRKMEVGFYLYLPSGEERLSDLTFRILDYEYQILGEKTENGIINQVEFKKNLFNAEDGNIKLKMVLHSQYYDNTGIIGIDLFVKEK